MVKPEVISEEPITMVEMKEELKRIKKRDKELHFRSQRTEDYLNQFVHVKPDEAKKFIAKLEGLKIPRLKDIHIFKIVDLMPTTVDGLKVILQGYTVSVNNDNMKKIVDAVKSFLPDKK